MSEKVWYLKRCDLFERLSPEQLSGIETRSRIRKYPRSSPVYLPDDQADGVLLLAEGRVRISNFTAGGKQAILAFIEPGELFGELALFDSGGREEFAETAEPSTIVLIPGDEMRRLMEAAPQVALGVTKLIGLRRRRIERRLKSLLFRSNRERLVHLLLELADQYGRPDPGGILIDIKLSHQDLANVIGSTRETVTVTLGELQAEGAVRIARRTIVLTNPKRLATSIDQAPPRTPGGSHEAAQSRAPISAPVVKPRPDPRRM